MGAHMAVLDGDIALGTTHQTAQTLVCATRDGALNVEVADGGAIDVVEWSAEVLGGSAVEGQCVVLSVERTLERVIACTCHLRRFNVSSKFYGLAAETIKSVIFPNEFAEVSPTSI